MWNLLSCNHTRPRYQAQRCARVHANPYSNNVPRLCKYAAQPFEENLMSSLARYVTDPMHTCVTFEVKHFATSTLRARFGKVHGTIDLDMEHHAGHAGIDVDTASISSGIAEFDQHLKSDAFLDVTTHPTAHFVGSDFRWQGERLVAVAGALTLRGQTHPVVLDCRNFNRYDSPIHHAPVAGGDFETTIQRSQWGITWGIDLGVPDAVHLVIAIEAVQQVVPAKAA
jgi:polyisoprenoid-binding protein YceI